MKKREFISLMRARFSNLSKSEADERISFLCEMIDDKIEDGLTEDEAIRQIYSANLTTPIGRADQQIASEAPTANQKKEKNRPSAATVVLLIVGSPLWISLAVAAFAVVLSLYITLWSVVITLWAAFGSLLGSGIGCIVATIIFSFTANPLIGAALFGIALACLGMSAFLFVGSLWATKGTVNMTVNIFKAIKNRF